MSSEWPAITAEMIEPWRPSVIDEIQRLCINAEIERHKAALAEVTSPEFAEWAYTPTAFESYFALDMRLLGEGNDHAG